MIDNPWFYVAAIPAVILLGLAKGGFAGVGNISMPLIALTISPVRGAAIVLPILIVQDAVGMWAFRRSVDWRLLAMMLPGTVVGVALGYFFAARVSVNGVLAAVGFLSTVFGLYRLWIERSGPVTATRGLPEWIGNIFGAASGFTSQIAHAGAPPYQMWVMPRGLPRDLLVGTTAVYFGITNWVKVPAYAALGQFTTPNMLVTATLLPIAIASTFAGVVLVRRVPSDRFNVIIYVLMILVGLKLVWDAFF
jgi:uncharacterized membrane protein YfcA